MLTVLFFAFSMTTYVHGQNITNGTEKAPLLNSTYKIVSLEEMHESFKPCKGLQCDLNKLKNKVHKMTKLSKILYEENNKVNGIVKQLEKDIEHFDGNCETELKRCLDSLADCEEHHPHAGSKSFHLHNKLLTWQEAFEECQDLGERLATIHNEKDMEALQAVIPEPTMKVWLAGVKDPNKKKFHWEQGNKRVRMTFTQWGDSEPKSTSERECLTSDQDSWYPEDCTGTYKFVCERV